MQRKRRSVSPFSLSFLDIMFCGFGAVVLLVLLLNGDTVRVRREASGELQAEAAALEQRLATAATRLDSVTRQLNEAGAAIEQTEASSRELASALQSERDSASQSDSQTHSRAARVESLKQQLRSLERENAQLAERSAAAKAEGNRTRQFLGEGDRQYLTGLKLGGNRVLVLLDRSASMLDETLVNIIIKRNLSENDRRQSKKWQRALATMEWLLANLPGNGKYQIITFDTRATAAVKGTDGTWLAVNDGAGMDAAVGVMRRIAPLGGTSLYHAFKAAGELTPRPDNIVLITDGLPTQGRQKPGGDTVTAGQRLDLFNKAMEALPAGVPVNTILLPMEGDAYAAAAFWELAVRTRGSFLTPSREWP